MPSVGPTTADECTAFTNLTHIHKSASSAIGWVIGLANDFYQGGLEDINNRILPTVHEQLTGINPRLCTGYACLLYFAEKVKLLQLHFITVMPHSAHHFDITLASFKACMFNHVPCT